MAGLVRPSSRPYQQPGGGVVERRGRTGKMGKLHSKLHTWGNGRWTTPVVSGLLIVASFVVAKVFGSRDVGSIFVVAAAALAGTPIVLKAARALTARVIGIDLLVS